MTIIQRILFLLFYTSGVWGTPEVSLMTGRFRGVSTDSGIDKFLGIPFALTPIGALRFKAPVPIRQASNEVFDASVFGDACPQPVDPDLDIGAPVGEDCLRLNIWRPQNITSHQKLPVLFWLPGGAFTVNSATSPTNDPTEIIQRSVAIGKPIIFVSANYRLNTFGFLASATIPPEDLNAGLQDQRVALEFVQDNIAAFGGDPKKVTIWGQSAGAGSVQALYIYPPKRELFRAGIADSATGPFKNSPGPATYDKPGKPFTRLLEATGCQPGDGAVQCLQAIPFDTLLNISNTLVSATLNRQFWEPTVGPAGNLVPVRASEKIAAGDFLRLPFIGGTNLNEGTFFDRSLSDLGLSGAAEDDAFRQYISDLFIDNSTLTPELVDTYLTMFPSNDSSLGAPFNSGDSLFDRAEAWYTEQMFLSGRRFFFQHGAGRQHMWAYHFAEFIPGNNVKAGVTHISELELIFGPIPAIASIENPLATMMRDFYINFMNDMDPGSEWHRYTPGSPRVLQLIRDNVTMIDDDWDIENTNFMNSQMVLDVFEK